MKKRRCSRWSSTTLLNSTGAITSPVMEVSWLTVNAARLVSRSHSSRSMKEAERDRNVLGRTGSNHCWVTVTEEKNWIHRIINRRCPVWGRFLSENQLTTGLFTPKLTSWSQPCLFSSLSRLLFWKHQYLSCVLLVFFFFSGEEQE